jgi:hypothetical protein
MYEVKSERRMMDFLSGISGGERRGSLRALISWR